MGLRGGKREDDVCRRLLKRLEKRVERRLRQHVNFVNEVHLIGILAACRSEVCFFPQAANLIDAAVAGGVQFDEIERTTLPVGPTALAFVAGVSVLRVGAVDGLSEKTARGGLAGTPWAREQIGVRYLVRLHGVRERTGDGLLSGQFRERVRTPFPIQDFGTHGADW